MFPVITRWCLGVVLLLAAATPAAAQLRAELFVSGLTQPIAFVQDPSQPNVHVVAQQNGLVRVVVNGVLGGTFLDLTTQTVGTGESGLLGFAFAPDYATSRRFFVNFTNLNGDTIVARFERRVNDPLEADPSSRFDLVWPGGLPFLDQPFNNHNGGHLAFGPDGYLYIGVGDGGSGNDPFHFAQTPSTLFGKMLRIDVDVPDNDPEGYDVPPDNPFVGNPAVLPEIWAFGLRNPWRYSFDNPALGGTGALVIGDVGQTSWEEIDYEPAGAGGRNYGWRNREGAHDNVTDLAPFSLPLVDPIFEYDHDTGRSVTGGVVYRGTGLHPVYRGRYFFGDFINSRIWSVALSVDPVSGEATVTDVVEHTAELGAAALFPSSFTLGFEGEIYIVSYTGSVFRIAAGLVTNGNFAKGMNGWTTFATPDPSHLVGGLNGGVFEFYREAPPPGTSNQAVVFQSTGMALPAGTRIQARFDIGNSSSVRKRLSVVLTDHDFSDLFVCTFWLEPGAPLRTYEMHSHTTEPWESATIAFYAASIGSQGGFYRLDNVSLLANAGGSATRTECVDPLAPEPPGGAAGPTLLQNGAFSAGLPPWVTFGQIDSQIAGGVFEFRRLPGSPAGAVLQQSNDAIAAGEILTATFALGNSSGVRQRVTVLLHDVDFSDLTACTFWLAPGTPLQTHRIVTYATAAWNDATLSVYPASSSTTPWLRLDDVTLQRTPSSNTVGTECFEPGGAGGLATTGEIGTGRAPRSHAWRQSDPHWPRADRAPARLPAFRDAAAFQRPPKPPSP